MIYYIIVIVSTTVPITGRNLPPLLTIALRVGGLFIIEKTERQTGLNHPVFKRFSPVITL